MQVKDKAQLFLDYIRERLLASKSYIGNYHGERGLPIIINSIDLQNSENELDGVILNGQFPVTYTSVLGNLSDLIKQVSQSNR